jgi:hypothetical protein
MQDKREYTHDNILSTLKQITVDRAAVNTRGLNEEDREVIDLEEERETDEPEDEDEALLVGVELDEPVLGEADETSSKEKGYNVNCVCDVWSKGASLLCKDGIKNARNNEHDRFNREKKLMKAIGDYIRNASSSKRDTKLKPEDEDMSDTEAVEVAKGLSSFD